jgi:hypothetical protein
VIRLGRHQRDHISHADMEICGGESDQALRGRYTIDLAGLQ